MVLGLGTQARRTFYGSVITLATGTTIAQAIPIGLSPILTRLYTPEEFGLFALFGAIVGLTAIAATGKYELAVMLTRDEEDADAIVVLSTSIVFCFALVLLLVALFFRGPIAGWLGEPGVASWLFVVPLSVFVTGSYQALNYWLNRHSRYSRMSANRIMQAGISGAGQVGAGFTALGAAGLILGSLVAQVVTTSLLGWAFLRGTSPSPVRMPGLLRRCLRLAVEYRNHPFHVLPAQWASSATVQIPIFVLSSGFGAAVTGLFSLAYRMISMPTMIVSEAIGDVYRQQASVAYREKGEFRSLYVSTVWLAFKVGIVPLIVLFVTAPGLFALVFGEPWRVAGEYTKLLAIAAFLQFVFTPVDKGALIVGATRYIVVWGFSRFIAIALVGVLTIRFGWAVETFLVWYVVVNSAFYVFDGAYEYHLSTGPVGQVAA